VASREGAGRKPNGAKPGVSHLRRLSFATRYPVHVTLRMVPAVGFLRTFSRVQAVEHALREVRHRFGLRVVHYSIQGNHLHLIVEIDDAAMLSRALNGLAVRLARALNRLASRNGKVFLDRYHAHVLKTPREVRNAVRYVLENFRHHLREDVAPAGADPCSSAAWWDGPLSDDAPIASPETWLLRNAFLISAG
jgi:putative transposase